MILFGQGKPNSPAGTMTQLNTPQARNRFLVSLFVAAAGLTAGCSTIDSASNSVASKLNPYRPEVVQGNVVTQEQVSQLKAGLSKLQVRQLLSDGQQPLLQLRLKRQRQ